MTKKIPTQLTDAQRVQCQLLIQAHPLFSHLPLEVSLELTNLFTFSEHPPGDVIAREGDEVDCIYFIASGGVSVTRHFAQIDSTHVANLKVGDAIGLSDSGFYSSTLKRCATVTAKTKTKLFCLKIEKFNSYLSAHADYADTIHANSKLLSRILFINELSELAHLPSASVLFLANKIEEISIPSSQFVFHENEEGEQCYLLKTGRVEILVNTNGKTKQLAMLTAPAIFGEAAIVTSSKRNASVRALENCQLLTIDKATLLKALEENPEAAKTISGLIAQRKQIRDNFFHFTKNGWIASRY